MGALKSYEDIWLLGKRTRHEVGIVARKSFAWKKPLVTTSIPEVATYGMTTSLNSSTASDFCNFLETLSYGRTEEATDVFV